MMPELHCERTRFYAFDSTAIRPATTTCDYFLRFWTSASSCSAARFGNSELLPFI